MNALITKKLVTPAYLLRRVIFRLTYLMQVS